MHSTAVVDHHARVFGDHWTKYGDKGKNAYEKCKTCSLNLSVGVGVAYFLHTLQLCAFRIMYSSSYEVCLSVMMSITAKASIVRVEGS